MLYLDYAATTPVRQEIRAEMETYFSEQFANPNSPHEWGLRAKKAVAAARERIAAVLGCSPSRIIFTSGGTESNNMAILGVARASAGRRGLITSAVEHKSVLGPMAALQKDGFRLDFAPLDGQGMVLTEEFEGLISSETLLVSLGHANNEIGTVQPVEKLAPLLKAKGALLHLDAVQSFGKIPVLPVVQGADLVSVSGHKIYGPKGIGLLYVGPQVSLEPLMYGGGQERKLRPGTLNVPGIMGFAKAVELAAEELKRESFRLSLLRDELITRALAIEGSYLNGHPVMRLPNNINLGFKGIEGQAIAMELEKRGVAVSTVSACSSGSAGPSHVLLALARDERQAREGLRISLGFYTGRQDILRAVANLSEVVKDLRMKFSVV